jgi:hypothetical protein
VLIPQSAHLILDLKEAYPEFPITVYLRNSGLDSYLTQTAGVKRVVHGTYDEFEKISALAKEHDVVINVGSSWDTNLSEAIVSGLKQRPDGKKTTLLHMSGTGNFVDKSWIDGAHHENAKIWNASLYWVPKGCGVGLTEDRTTMWTT